MNTTYNVNALTPGTMIQEYRIVDVLGAGSFGIIYLAENTYLPERVAIKEFLPNDVAQRTEGSTVAPKTSDSEEAYRWALDKFLKEARILWELGEPNRHPNIIGVKRFHEENGTAYMVMDFEEGEPLDDRLERDGTLSESALREILFPLLDGLARVHECAVWHRDIKPANVLIRPDGSPVLIDFGAARQEAGRKAASVLAMYTPDYAAPEQIYETGNVGPWTDIYALGATLYRAVTGKPPATPPQRALGAEHVPAATAAADRYSPAFLEAIDAAIELDPEQRPQSVAEWRSLFEEDTRVSPQAAGGDTVLRPSHGSPASAGGTGALDDLLGQAGEPRRARSSRERKESFRPRPRDTRQTVIVGAVAGGVLLAALAAGGFFFLQSEPDQVASLGDSETEGAAPESSPDEPPSQGPADGAKEGTTGEQTQTAQGPETTDGPVTPPGTSAPRADSETDLASAPRPESAEMPPEPEVFDRQRVLARARGLASSAGCGALTVALSSDRRLLVSGHAKSWADVDRLAERLSTIEEVRSLEFEVDVRNSALCEVIEVLDTSTNAGWKNAFAPIIEPSKPGYEYVEGELLQLTAVSTLAFRNYLYIDYIDGEGNVLHLLPTPHKRNNKLLPGEEIVLGKDRRYEIAPPHGESMIIAVASRSPLFGGLRPEFETLGDYLPALRAGLGRMQNPGEATEALSDYVFIKTRPP